MATKPKQTRLIEFDALYREDNIRTAECEQIPEMVGSLKENGFKDNHPLVVSEKADKRYLVLCGNRRVKGLETLRHQSAEDFAAALPSGKVPCVVHKGLTAEEEILLRIDHGPAEDRVALDDWSQFLAIEQLVRAMPGDSQTLIAEKLGIWKTKGKDKGQKVPNRDVVQKRVNLVRLPAFVREEYRKLCQGGNDATPVRWTHITALYKAFREEFADNPDGDGPKFSEAWKTVLNPKPKAPRNTGDDGPKALTPEAAEKRATAATSGTVKRLLLAITNQGSYDPVALDAHIASVESDSATLDDIREYLSPDDYSDLVNKARDARMARELTEQAQTDDDVANAQKLADMATEASAS